MFMIAAATSLGCLIMALFIYRTLFNEKAQLKSQLITKQKTGA
jgi:ABC-type iron transport system FetAB permease component